MGLEGALDTTIYVIAGDIRPGFPIADWLRRRCIATISELETIEALPTHLRLAHADGCDRPALAILATLVIDDEFLHQCRRVQRLVEEGWLGLVVVVENEPPQASAVDAALKAGCLDVVHVSGPQTFPHLQARLKLAARVLSERRLRIAREQMYQAQLAERRIMEARQRYVASHDTITDLANRRAFEEVLAAAIDMGRRRGITHALLHLDLDRFKLHNDAAGHDAGDYLLLAVANLLRAILPPEYVAARLGGDEFAVLLQGTNEDEAMRLADELRSRIAALEPDGNRIVYHVAASIGVAVFPPGAVPGASQALAQAEQACYVAKTRGGNAIHRYSRDDRALQHLREDMHWAPHIRRALNEDRFFLAFQPILSVADNAISHYEALVRIPAAYGGDGETARFMLAAERLGLAQQIDMWVVSRALDFLAEHEDLSLGVNLSSHAFHESGLLPLLKQRLETTQIAPERLTFEITETAAIMNFAQTRHMIGEINSLGCRFALDDFGAGFSSYHYIKQFPIHMLKIDGSFIIGLRHDPKDQAIVQSMVDIGHSLDKLVVAEFIEDADTFQMLVEMGIDLAQGYYIGRPSSTLPSRMKRELQ